MIVKRRQRALEPMQLLELTLNSPEENLALDEALLETAEAASDGSELLRFWESPQKLAVVGRASKVAEELDLAACDRQNVPILRRCSGGASILAGPGCLMYAVVLDCRQRPHLKMIPEAHQLVMQTMCAALATIVKGVRFEGTCDLTLNDQKFSGNSLRCKRNCLLYHGTLLYDFPLDSINELLRMPPRRPDYRRDRDHNQFVTNLPASVHELKRAIAAQWQADQTPGEWPRQMVRQLVVQRYSQTSWNRRL